MSLTKVCGSYLDPGSHKLGITTRHNQGDWSSEETFDIIKGLLLIFKNMTALMCNIFKVLVFWKYILKYLHKKRYDCLGFVSKLTQE